MKVITLKPSEVTINPLIAARSGEPSPEKVGRLATNMLERREQGRDHQIQPGLVRSVGKGDKITYELIAGRHRLEAIKLLNENLPKDASEDDRFDFSATVVRADDDAAILDALDENEFHVASSVFDKAAAISRLMEHGKTQAEVAKRLQISEGQVSRILKAKDCPKKYRKMVEDGDMTEDALLLLMALPAKDSATRQEIADLAIDYRKREDEIAERIAAREEEEEEEEEDEEEENGKGKAKGKPKKAVKKAPAKEKKGKVTKADVKAAARDKGVATTPSPLTRRQFQVMLQALGDDQENVLPKSADNLIATIWAVTDGEKSLAQFRNALIKYCKTNEQYEKDEAKRKREVAAA